MLLEALSTARDIGRLHEIVSVLVRHGLGDAVRRLGMAHTLERAGRVVHWKSVQGLSKEPQVRVREALEALGPTFVKVGQILAGRADLLPPAWTEELSRLHERAAPAPPEAIRAQLALDLGADPCEVFHDFEEEPVAAASIAQVYRAALPGGRRVALKVRRPGIEEVVEADLRLLARLAERAEERMPELRRFRPKGLVRQLARSLRNELDLRVEARNAARLRANLPEDSRIVIPRMHAEWTRERLCVMDWLEGESLSEWLRGGGGQGAEASRIAAIGAETVLATVFVDGCFHADPHPGNLILLADGRLGLVDFGMVGHLSEARRFEFLNILFAVASRDVDEVVETVLDWSNGEVDVEALTLDCAAFIDRYTGLPLRELDAGEVLRDLTAILRENDLSLPNDVALLLKVFLTLDGVGRRLDPDFVMSTYVEPFAVAAVRAHHSPGAIARRGAKEVRSFLTGLPRDLRHLSELARRGRIRIDIDIERLERFGQKLDSSANRVTVGLVTAALIVGTSISLTVPGEPSVAGLPLFGFLGFSSSILAGFWLLWSIIRSKKS